jgi:Ca-activated chloride channel family protein
MMAAVKRQTRFLASLLMLCLVTASPSLALPQGEKEQSGVVKLSADLVSVTVTVLDEDAHFVSTLKKEDIVLYEDGVKQEITFFNTDEKTPVSIGILFDTSGSMADKLEGVQDAVKHFIDLVNPEDDIFLIRFSTGVQLVQDFTADRRLLYRGLDRLKAFGATSLYDAIYQGLLQVRNGKHQKKALLVITDGNDTVSRVTHGEVLTLARKSEVLIYCLGIGHGEKGSFGHSEALFQDVVDINVLRSLSEASGGRSYLLEEELHGQGVDKIDRTVQDIAKELRGQYTLGYSPTNTKKDGSYRTIRIEVKKGDYLVRAKPGYQALKEDG